MTMLFRKTDAAVELAQFVIDTKWGDIPPTILERTALNVLDTIASAAGGHSTKNASEMRSAAAAIFGAGKSRVWFCRHHTHRAAAILANCAAASALDIDDGHRGASGHPGAAIVPAVLLACAELEFEVRARDLLAACAIGYDVACRIAASRLPGTVKTYSSGRWVGYGVAAALGWLQRLSPETVAHGMTIAGAESPENLPAGSYRQVSSVKGGSPWSTLTAWAAVERAKAGAEGPLDSLNRTDVFDRSLLTRELGQRWEVAHTYLKPYASCRYAHAATDAVLTLVQGTSLRLDDVDELIVEVFPEAFTITNEEAPESLEGAQFSIPFNVAVAALRGAAAFRPMRPELLRDLEVLALSKKVQLREAEDMRCAFPRFTPSRVKLKTGGKWCVETVTHPLGDVNNPMSWAQVEQKCRDLIAGFDADLRAQGERVIQRCNAIAQDFDRPASELLHELY
jgi:2-methylcitrate dehydratase PrpD